MFIKLWFSGQPSEASPGYFLVCSSVKIPIEFSISKKRMKTNGSSARRWQDGGRPPVHEDTPSHTPPPHPGVSAAMVDGGSVSGRVCNGCTFLFSEGRKGGKSHDAHRTTLLGEPMGGGSRVAGGGLALPRGGRVRERRRREDRGGAAPREPGGFFFRPPFGGAIFVVADYKKIRKGLEGTPVKT
jgi:hypothetical protein